MEAFSVVRDSAVRQSIVYLNTQTSLKSSTEPP